VAVYDVAGGITAIAKNPRATAGKTYQFVGYGQVQYTYAILNIIPIIFTKCEYFIYTGRTVINCLIYLTGSIG